MKSELNTGSIIGSCSQLDSTQTFILKPVASDQPHRSSHIIHSSAPQPQSARHLPVFNADRKHFTPAFLAPSHLSALSQHDQEYRDAFLIKTQEECLHTSLLLQPKPSSTFCFVCKEHFQDYSKHISHPVHRKFIASSPCEDMIHELIQSEHKKRRTPVSGSVEPEALPRKMRKQQLSYEDWNLWDLLLLWPCNTSKRRVLVSPFFNPQLTASDLLQLILAILHKNHRRAEPITGSRCLALCQGCQRCRLDCFLKMMWQSCCRIYSLERILTSSSSLSSCRKSSKVHSENFLRVVILRFIQFSTWMKNQSTSPALSMMREFTEESCRFRFFSDWSWFLARLSSSFQVLRSSGLTAVECFISSEESLARDWLLLKLPLGTSVAKVLQLSFSLHGETSLTLLIGPFLSNSFTLSLSESISLFCVLISPFRSKMTLFFLSNLSSSCLS